MACTQKQLDPVQGLIDYTLEIKPYHTKIIEVLVEYIHTDSISVEILDELEWCVNLGIPDLSGLFSNTILSANPSQKTFTVDGDLRKKVFMGQKVQVFLSTGNNGRYNVSNVAYNIVTEETTISVRENIPFAIADGIITDKVIEYCPGGEMLSSYVATLDPEISLVGGWGVQWGPTRQFQVFSIDNILNQIIIPGDYRFQFNTASKILLDYYDDDVSLYTTKLEFDAIESRHFVVSPEIAAVTYDGTNTYVQTTDPLPLNFVYGFAEALPILDIIGTDNSSNYFIVDGAQGALFPLNIPFNVRFTSNGNDGRYTPVNVIVETLSTKVYVAENISNAYNNANATDGKVFITGHGWDEVGTFSTVSEGKVAVTFNENLIFNNIGITFEDTMYMYNGENSAAEGFGGLSYETISSPTEPNVDIQAMAPVSPSLFDLWYDTTNEQFNYWLSYKWVPIQTIFWLDTVNDQMYRRTKTRYTDTGWFATSVDNSDATTKGFGEGGWATEPYTLFHGQGNVSVDITNNTYNISGGNFGHYFFGGTEVSGFNGVGLAGKWKEKTFGMVGLNGTGTVGTHSFVAEGDLTTTFTIGRHFYVSQTIENQGWYTINSSSLDSNGNTILQVDENIVDNSILGQIDPRATGIIHGALFAPEGVSTVRNPATILHVQQIVDASVEMLTYYWRGPMHIKIDTVPDSVVISPTFTDNNLLVSNELMQYATNDVARTVTEAVISEQISFGWAVGSYYSFLILEAETVTDTFRVSGDQRPELQIGQDINVTSSPGYDATYKVQSSLFNGTDTIIQVTPQISVAGTGGFILPIEDLGSTINLFDTIGVSVAETSDAAILTTGLAAISGAFDYPYWDIGGFDENLGTVIHLYSS